jgi:hypothetical protein
MKKFIIASLVGTLIIFLWSAISWTALPIHTHSFRYTPKQDSIMKVLTGSSLETGEYMMPMVDNRNVGMFDKEAMKKHEEMMKNNVGKPFAMIMYNKEGISMDPCQFIIGLLVDLFAVMCVVILLVMAREKLTTFFMRWWAVMIIGFVVALNSYMLEWNWLHYPWHFLKGEIIDTFVEWGLCGAWLSWYIGRK